MNPTSQPGSAGSWPDAVRLIERWLERGERVDALLESGTAGAAAGGPARAGADRSRCQHLLFGVVRHFGRLDAALATLVPRRPRARLRAVLLAAGFELLEQAGSAAGEGQAAKIVHHAVAQAKVLLSPAEARLVNAVLRRMAGSAELDAPPPEAGASPAELARHFSHPEWLVRRWLANLGAETTRSLLIWNQTPAPVYARWRSPETPPDWIAPTTWAGFWIVPAGRWAQIAPWLAEGHLFLQDPATLLAAELLDPRPGETLLDLCAAPGGKSLLLADMLAARAAGAAGNATDAPAAGGRAGLPNDLSSQGLAQNEASAKAENLAKDEGLPKAGLPAVGLAKAGRVVSVDLPDERRIGRLKENLAKARGVDVALVQADARRLTPALWRAHGLPGEYPAVLLDVPCSNTGVMRHRVDVKWRLRESDIGKHAAQQLTLLAAASRLVAPGGRIVYSTCSLEPEENEGVVEAFLRRAGGRFVLEQTRGSRPWESGCDGAAAFLLRKNA